MESKFGILWLNLVQGRWFLRALRILDIGNASEALIWVGHWTFLLFCVERGIKESSRE